MSKKLATVILAAGQGTRMKSDLPKVLHALAGEPMVSYPIRLALELGSSEVVLVVGHGADAVKDAVRARFEKGVSFQVQKEQKGTGHATRIGMKSLAGHKGRVLLLYGDVPLLKAKTIRAMAKKMDSKKLSVCITTMRLDSPKGYGRIVRDDKKRVVNVVEEKDCNTEQRLIDEVNAGIYLVDADFLQDALARLKNNNAQKEYYLTDIVGFAVEDGLKVDTLVVPDGWEVSGVNNRGQLAALAKKMRSEINDELMTQGVTLIDPDHTYIGPRVKIGRDTIIHPNVHIRGETTVGKRCEIDTGTVIMDASIGNDVAIHPNSIVENAMVKNSVTIGPFARLRPGAELMDEAKVGNFVELKKTRLGKGAKANHLAYLGDATIGPGANVGAGTITCNYDGYGKHRTIIGDGVFVGSNSTLVAPLSIEKNAYVAAGSTITDEIKKDDLAFGRAKQVNKTGRAKQVREAAAKAAGKK